MPAPRRVGCTNVKSNANRFGLTCPALGVCFARAEGREASTLPHPDQEQGRGVWSEPSFLQRCDYSAGERKREIAKTRTIAMLGTFAQGVFQPKRSVKGQTSRRRFNPN